MYPADAPVRMPRRTSQIFVLIDCFCYGLNQPLQSQLIRDATRGLWGPLSQWVRWRKLPLNIFFCVGGNGFQALRAMDPGQSRRPAYPINGGQPIIMASKPASPAKMAAKPWQALPAPSWKQIEAN